MSLRCRCVALIIGRSIAAAMKKHGGGTAEQIRLPPPARFGLEPIRWREWKPPPRTTRRHSMGPIWHLNDDLPNSGREQSAPCSGLDRILRNAPSPSHGENRGSSPLGSATALIKQGLSDRLASEVSQPVRQAW